MASAGDKRPLDDSEAKGTKMEAVKKAKTDCDDDEGQKAQWWQIGPIYQIYPKSFMDSEGKGVGTLKGKERLSLQALISLAR